LVRANNKLRAENMAHSFDSPTAGASPHESPGILDFIKSGLTWYYLTSLIVVLGVLVGHEAVRTKSGRAAREGLPGAFSNWDGNWYTEIATDGYSWDPEAGSVIAFFPGYPWLGRCVAFATGLPSRFALLLVSHLCLAGAFVFLAAYLHHRLETEEAVRTWTLLALGLAPTTFFFRMAYSESLFLLLSIAALHGMQRQWPLFIIACVIGLATATRAVGVALLLPLLLHVASSSPTWTSCLRNWGLYVPLACWGIAGFVVFQWLTFDNPWAFVQTQSHWRFTAPVSLGTKTQTLVSLEPIWGIICPNSVYHWRKNDPDALPFFSLYLANPVYFTASVGLIALGAIKRWLTRNEVVLAAALLLIPYVTKSQQIGMISMGRFASVAFPVYLVIGFLLARLPVPVAVAFLVFSGTILALYSALFAASHSYFF
jgi:hypothetical protein